MKDVLYIVGIISLAILTMNLLTGLVEDFVKQGDTYKAGISIIKAREFVKEGNTLKPTWCEELLEMKKGANK